jgi:hypothetical protein
MYPKAPNPIIKFPKPNYDSTRIAQFFKENEIIAVFPVIFSYQPLSKISRASHSRQAETRVPEPILSSHISCAEIGYAVFFAEIEETLANADCPVDILSSDRNSGFPMIAYLI